MSLERLPDDNKCHVVGKGRGTIRTRRANPEVFGEEVPL